ncbi:putative ATP-dependent DNA helicase [Sphingobium yanoikuyae]|uniref:DNA 3'-5' helicase n=1 Tax=Sphingobium yanoikuyae TaxID=13690 RepID=A0A084ETN3_SPHYA|nr:putative ATP-dependent DNA helicase [Sphingobium yanoikuyae]
MFARSKTYRPSLWLRLFLADNWTLTLIRSQPQDVKLGSGKLASIDITAISVTRALLWHAVEIRTRDSVTNLTGLSGNAARQLRDDLHSFVNLHLAALIDKGKGQLMAVDQAITAIVEGKRQYLAQSDISRAIAEVPGSASLALSHPLFHAALMPAALRTHLPTSFRMLTDAEERQRYNEAFVEHEMREFSSFFDQLEGLSLSDEQREACIRLEDSNLLVACAGSGKSATMVSKVSYVLEKGLHAPSEILVLAFNKNAADQLKDRIARQLGVEAEELECRITTFHALGLGIIKEAEGRPPQLANWVDNAHGEARFIDGIIDALMKSNEEFRTLWLDMLLLYPKADIPPSQFDSAEEYRRHMADNSGKRPESILSQSGIYVKSLQELKIANWLWQHSVEFKYERRTKVQDEDGGIRHVDPDFYYPATDTIHEHFAIDADGTSPFRDYVKHAKLKRAGYARIGADFFETTSAQSADGSLLDQLRSELEKREIELTPKSPEEIMKTIPSVVMTRYRKIIGVCIKHIRASSLTLEMLQEKAKTLHDKHRATRFAKVIWLITQAYSQKLEQDERIDFDSMIGDATKLVEAGRYRSPYSLILVDEFQDISDSRAKLIKALKHQRAFTKMFAVGDDWQSIYRFTGSDITIFTEFEANFGASWQGRLQRTYRCNQTLAEAAARFIQKNPAQMSKQVTSSRPAVRRSIRAIPVKVEWGKPRMGDACFKVFERLDRFLSGIQSQWRESDEHRLKVLVLWRYNMLDPFHAGSPMYDCIEVSGLSFHRSKGLEADYTILMDVSEGDYGVPSRIEDDELLNLVIPRPEEFEYAEERRLFYVALTRASRGTFLLYNSSKPSRFISELCAVAGDDVRFETVDGVRLMQCPACVTGRLIERQTEGGISIIGCSSHPRCSYVRRPSGV